MIYAPGSDTLGEESDLAWYYQGQGYNILSNPELLDISSANLSTQATDIGDEEYLDLTAEDTPLPVIFEMLSI